MVEEFGGPRPTEGGWIETVEHEEIEIIRERIREALKLDKGKHSTSSSGL